MMNEHNAMLKARVVTSHTTIRFDTKSLHCFDELPNAFFLSLKRSLRTMCDGWLGRVIMTEVNARCFVAFCALFLLQRKEREEMWERHCKFFCPYRRSNYGEKLFASRPPTRFSYQRSK